jgi:hypothetical protein
MEFASDRLPQLFAAMLMTLATVILLGPGAPSVLAQHAADQAMARLRVRRSKMVPRTISFACATHPSTSSG